MSPQRNKNDSRERTDEKHIEMSEEAICQMEKNLAALEEIIADAQREAAAMRQILNDVKSSRTTDANRDNDDVSPMEKVIDIMVAQACRERQAQLAMNGTEDATAQPGDR